MSFLVLVIGQAFVAAVFAATAWAAGSVVDRAMQPTWRVTRGRAGAGVDASKDYARDAAATSHEAASHEAASHEAASHEAPIPWALTMALGFAAIGQVLTLAGLAGMLRKPVVLAVTIGVHLAAIPAWRRVVAGAVAARLATQATAGRAFGVAIAVIIALTAFLLTLYPPLGFDQTMYHLPQTRAFAASGALPFLPALRYPIFPPLAEVLNASVLMFAGDVATQATGWVALMACAGLAYAWARDLATDDEIADALDGVADEARGLADAAEGRAGALAQASGWLAAAVIAGSPIALYLAACGYVEPLLALFGGASLYAADRARITHDARWLVAAGFLAGSAASVKYLGLYFVPAAALLLVWHAPGRVVRPAAFTSSTRVARRDVVIYGVAAAAALLPCYGRLIAHTGNPVFPFFPELFGANQWAEDIITGPSGATRWMLTVTRLWDVTFRREAIGGLPHFSPAFLCALPVIVIAAWQHRRFRAPLLIAIGYLVLAPTHAHYLFTIAVLWSALGGAAVAAVLLNVRSVRSVRHDRHGRSVRDVGHARRRGSSNAMIAAAVLLACGGEAYALHRVYRLGLPPVTSEGRERLLAEQRLLYPAIAWLNRNAGPVTLYAINAELMVDYASGTLLGDYNGAASFDRMEARVRATGSVAAALDALGASHLLVPKDASASSSTWNAEASRDPRLTRIYSDDHATLYRVVY
jgi:Dolichyl-phosphate-mannose-protein mannosyltransferase